MTLVYDTEYTEGGFRYYLVDPVSPTEAKRVIAVFSCSVRELQDDEGLRLVSVGVFSTRERAERAARWFVRDLAQLGVL